VTAASSVPSGPFTGLTVVEFGQFVVVPFCAQLMADAGARVIKVEPPTGDSYRTSHQIAPMEGRQFLIKNRGKESIAVDLGHPDAEDVVHALLRAADVVLVNLSPAAVLRRGLDYESVRAVNPRVVYGAATGFGQVGPEASLPGMDVVVQARSGAMSSLAAERDGLPFHSEVQVADYSAAMMLFGAVAAALYHRERTGVGQRVDVSLLGAALAVQNNSLAHVHELDQWRHEFVTDHLPRLRKEGADGARIEAVRRELRPDPPSHSAHYRVFRTADGAVALGAGSPHSRRRLVELTGVDGTLADSDPDAFGEQLAGVLVDRSTEEWVRLLRAADVPVSAVRHIDELFFDEHVEAEGMVADYDHPVVGRYRGLGVPFRMSATPLDGRGRPSPSFAAGTDRILAELGFDAPTREALVRSGAVLGAIPATTATTAPHADRRTP
jgi:crotonobetainyl-CoA:carnitine CoA-transferase CaiB-like acyl-CoA transferase